MMEHTTFSDFVANRHRDNRELHCLFEGEPDDCGLETVISTLGPDRAVRRLPEDDLPADLETVDLLVCDVQAMESEHWQSIVVRQRTGKVTQTDIVAVDTSFDHTAERAADAKITTTEKGAVDQCVRLVEHVYRGETYEVVFGGDSE